MHPQNQQPGVFFLKPKLISCSSVLLLVTEKRSTERFFFFFFVSVPRICQFSSHFSLKRTPLVQQVLIEASGSVSGLRTAHCILKWAPPLLPPPPKNRFWEVDRSIEVCQWAEDLSVENDPCWRDWSERLIEASGSASELRAADSSLNEPPSSPPIQHVILRGCLRRWGLLTSWRPLILL